MKNKNLMKDFVSVLVQVLKGLAEASLNLEDAPDFAQCVFNGIAAK